MPEELEGTGLLDLLKADLHKAKAKEKSIMSGERPDLRFLAGQLNDLEELMTYESAKFDKARHGLWSCKDQVMESNFTFPTISSRLPSSIFTFTLPVPHPLAHAPLAHKHMRTRCRPPGDACKCHGASARGSRRWYVRQNLGALSQFKVGQNGRLDRERRASERRGEGERAGTQAAEGKPGTADLSPRARRAQDKSRRCNNGPWGAHHDGRACAAERSRSKGHRRWRWRWR